MTVAFWVGLVRLFVKLLYLPMLVLVFFLVLLFALLFTPVIVLLGFVVLWLASPLYGAHVGWIVANEGISEAQTKGNQALKDIHKFLGNLASIKKS